MRRKPDAPIRRTYRFRLNGLVYLSVTAFLAVAAISSQNNLLFWCLGLAVAGIAVSGVISGTGLVGLRAEREAVPDASAGGPMVVRYRIRNTNLLAPAFGLMIFERDFPRKRAGLPWSRCLTRPVAFVPCIRPGQTVVADARPLATARGRPEFHEFEVGSTFPFGLANKALRFANERSALVYPKPLPVRPSVLRSTRAGGDQNLAVTTGGDGSDDFYGIREYMPGDPMRSVVWRASARVGELVVKQHARPAPTRLWVRLRLPVEGGDIEGVISLAAGVLKVASERNYAVGLLCPEAGIGVHAAVGSQGLRNCLGRLALIGTASAPERHSPAAEPVPGRLDLVLTVQASGGAVPGGGRALALDAPQSWSTTARVTGESREPAA